MVSELGGAAFHSGLQTRGLPGFRGRLSPEQLRATAWTDGDFWTPRTSVVALENTHNTAGGTVWPLDELRERRRRPRASSGCAFTSTERGS